MSRFTPPENFNFGNAAEWPDWKERFSRFRMATKLSKDEGEVQISALIYAMGREAEHIFKSFVFDNEDDKKDYEIVLEKYDEYFVPKRNIIHERAKFHQRSQKSGETVETFVRSLYEIAEHCEFPDKKEQIRDRLVIGILDRELSEKLQLTPELTLEKAVDMARQFELVKSQLKDQAAAQNIEAVRKQNLPFGSKNQ